jgi:hypothetical protein
MGRVNAVRAQRNLEDTANRTEISGAATMLRQTASQRLFNAEGARF